MKLRMYSYILTIGSELTSGIRANDNATHIAKHLTNIEIPPLHLDCVPDDPLEIGSTIRKALEDCDVLIITGGLGPTSDDITRECVAAALGIQLFENKEVLQKIREKLGTLTSGQRRQAQLPKGATYFPFTIGTAPGIRIQKDKKIIYLLPGVPAEMKEMLQTHILPELKKIAPKKDIERRVYKFCGVGEVIIEEELKNRPDIMTHIKEYSILPHGMEVRLKLGVSKKMWKDVESKLKELFPDVLYGKDDDTLIGVTTKGLIKKKLTVGVVESCTGGLVGKTLTRHSGSSDYFKGGIVAYSNEIKEKVVGVPSDVIKKYGAVSSECAKSMAENGLKKLGCDICVSVTGIAGPTGGTKEKPVGLVWFGVADKKSATTKSYNFIGDREMIRFKAAQTAINLIRLHASR